MVRYVILSVDPMDMGPLLYFPDIMWNPMLVNWTSEKHSNDGTGWDSVAQESKAIPVICVLFCEEELLVFLTGNSVLLFIAGRLGHSAATVAKSALIRGNWCCWTQGQCSFFPQWTLHPCACCASIGWLMVKKGRMRSMGQFVQSSLLSVPL